MIRFIICDDNEEAVNKASIAINKSMMNYSYEYRIDKFNSYNNELNKIINSSKDQKIYILDIELPKISGLEIASKIRKTDWKSTIIFVTAHPECKNDIFYSRLLALDFISKYKFYEERLKETIDVAIDTLGSGKVLIFEYHHTTYRIPYEDILYVEKMNSQRKCLIATKTGGTFTVKANIGDIYQTLGKGFYQSHKSCIVNIHEIKMVDYSNNIITFKNDETTDLLSNRMKRGLKEYITNY